MNYAFCSKKICKCGRYFNSGSLKTHICFTKQQFDEIYNLYLSGLSSSEILKKGYSKSLIRAILKDKHRSTSEAIKLARKNHPDSYKISDATRKKLRETRLNYLKTHACVWRNSYKKMSYPEKIFFDIIKRNNLTEKYDIVREHSIYPYYADFAFLNIKLDVEVDGSQHWLTEESKLKDKKRDRILNEKNWKVYRIPEFMLKREFEKIELNFLNYLKNIKTQPKVLSFDDKIIEYQEFKVLKEIKKQEDLKKHKQQLKLEKTNETKLLINKIENSNIDFSSFGWVKQASKLINKYPQKINGWMKENMLEFYQLKCFKRGMAS